MSSAPAALTPASGMSDNKIGVWAALTSFFLMWSFLYIVLVVFRPGWVCVAVREAELGCVEGSAKVEPRIDQTRAFVVALIVTLIVMLIVWLVAATAGKK